MSMRTNGTMFAAVVLAALVGGAATIAMPAVAATGTTAVAASGTTAASPAVASSTERQPEPFARVSLAVRGCSSCAHCRSTIRQMVRVSAKGGETKLGDDQIEVSYPSPAPVPLRDVIHSLAENRLHDLSLVDVLFSARGTIRTGGDGSRRFVLEETGQSFPIDIDPAVRHPRDGAPVRLVALVEGWRNKGDLTLIARTIDPAS